MALGHSGSPINSKSRRRRLCHVISCVNDHQGTDDQCSPISATCQYPSMPPVSAHQCHINVTYLCLPVHINAIYQCPSELPFSATYQCCQSVPPTSVSQCRLSVCISTTY
ncbi:unnamed protein product [Staurois parvus]|uniref:Uncharacterized protein n=1 Tax=Staurois parvus TaxID=386267 RepID=A0ABN9DPS4_9NEOB|nr:unnamed protein product [Staurois parvus]